jgi:hypothetical protein
MYDPDTEMFRGIGMMFIGIIPMLMIPFSVIGIVFSIIWFLK